MSQVNEKPIAPVAKQPVQQVQGVPQNASAQASKETAEAVRQIVCQKKQGEKWEIKFIGPVARRDINRILVTIRVAFARQKRKQRLNKAMTERKLSLNNPLGAAQLEVGTNGKS